MKKKKNIFGIICGFAIGTIISSLTATYAAASLSSNNVYYDNTNSGGSSSTVSGAIDELYAVASDQDALKAEIVDIIYPVGSIYISTTDSTTEAVTERFGGTWERYSTDTTLVGYKEGTNTANATGGSKTVTLTSSNLPNHTHTTTEKTVSNWIAASNGAHSHGAAIGAAGYEGWPVVSVSGYVFNRNSTVFSNTGGGTSSLNFMHVVSDAIVIGESGAHEHTVSGTIPSLTSNTCTDCGTTKVNVQNPYTVVYMYKRTA